MMPQIEDRLTGLEDRLKVVEAALAKLLEGEPEKKQAVREAAKRGFEGVSARQETDDA